MSDYVEKNSIVRQIWGKSDTVLFIFAGAAAEFAVNKAVDWLYFTGRLPADPLGRLFSTVAYAREIIFSSTEQANSAIDKMTSIHGSVERARGAVIPAEAYRDVLFMLIYYSISSYEALERKLSAMEKEEIVDVFLRVGKRMHITGLPDGFRGWQQMHTDQLSRNYEKSSLTDDLFRQYRKHLGAVRYFILIEVQKLLVPDRIRQLLNFKRPVLIRPVLAVYKILRNVKAHILVRELLLPPLYKQKIRALDLQP